MMPDSNEDYISNLRNTLGKVDQSLSYIYESVIWTDKTGKIEWCNNVFSQLIGVIRAEILNKNIDEVISFEKNKETITIQSICKNLVDNRAIDLLDYEKDGISLKIDFLCQKTTSYASSDYLIIVLRDVTKQEQMIAELRTKGNDLALTNKKLKEFARYDVVTTLPNRLYFQEILKRTLLRNEKNKVNLAVLFIDLDFYKKVNDQLGHDCGDDLLKQAGNRLQKVTRPTDFIARLGSDEFIIMVEGAEDIHVLSFLAKNILTILGKTFNVQTHTVRITASIGIAADPSDEADPEALLQHAELAMQQAKTRGRDQYCFYNEELDEEAKEYEKIKGDLKPAIDNNQFYLTFQKQIDLSTQALKGLEVLLRWRHPELGEIPPFRFVEIAEESGAIKDIDYWVLNTTCKQYKEWLDTKKMSQPISINVSAHELKQKGYAQNVLAVLRKHKIPAEKVILEITETSLIDNLEIARPILHELYDNGIRIAIDDFGTGYFSFQHLVSLPISEVKIDLTFVKGITTDKKKHAVCKFILKLAKALDLDVVAEGVETEEQVEALKELGCRVVQGFYYHKPVTADKLFEK
jgi:diguanylate cyclase (GGDEF)-like protein